VDADRGAAEPEELVELGRRRGAIGLDPLAGLGDPVPGLVLRSLRIGDRELAQLVQLCLDRARALGLGLVFAISPPTVTGFREA
jgi:hypothetical protein